MRFSERRNHPVRRHFTEIAKSLIDKTYTTDRLHALIKAVVDILDSTRALRLDLFVGLMPLRFSRTKQRECFGCQCQKWAV